MNSFAELIENVESMPIAEQELFIDIINKRFAERRKQLFVNDSLISKKQYVSGEYKSGTSEDLFKELEI